MFLGVFISSSEWLFIGVCRAMRLSTSWTAASLLISGHEVCTCLVIYASMIDGSIQWRVSWRLHINIRPYAATLFSGISAVYTKHYSRKYIKPWHIVVDSHSSPPLTSRAPTHNMLATGLNRQCGNVSHSYKKKQKNTAHVWHTELDCRCTASGLMPRYEALHNCDISFANPPAMQMSSIQTWCSSQDSRSTIVT